MTVRAKLVDWGAARAEYEIGRNVNAVAAKFGICRRTLQLRIKREAWEQDATVSLDLQVKEKVIGITTGSDPEKRAIAIDAAADEVAQVVLRHRQEWVDHKAILMEAMKNRDFDRCKVAKITSETIMIRQTGERRAWGIDKESTGKQSLIEWLEQA